MTVRAELFRTIYFHRTVRAIDMQLIDLFRDSRRYLLPGNPAENLSQYQQLTEWTLLVDVSRWSTHQDLTIRELGRAWQDLLQRRIRWKTVCQRTLLFGPTDAEARVSLPNAI